MRLNIPCVAYMWEIYALENVVLYIAVYGPYKPYISIYTTWNVPNALEINCIVPHVLLIRYNYGHPICKQGKKLLLGSLEVHELLDK